MGQVLLANTTDVFEVFERSVDTRWPRPPAGPS